ncbi:MAG TPA: AfsA-related hotdog domain-containing protein [Trinickia sp.]
MKSEKSVIVVGDKFQGFSDKHDDIVTLGQLEKMIWEAQELPIDRIVVGQGVCHQRLSGLQTIMQRRFTDSPPRIVNYEQIADQLDPALRQVTHKHHAQNILISAPRRASEHCYESKLAIHDATELLGDHMTGQHIQGMVLTEAGRQMMLAVAELFMLDAHERGRFYFILNKVATTYHRFAFPIETDAKLTVLAAERKRGNALHAEVRVDFAQQEEALAEAHISFAAYDKDLIARKEHELALTRVARMAQASPSYS